MCAQAAPEEDRATALIKPTMPWRVASAEVLEGFRLKVVFNDGTQGVVDMEPLITSPEAGVFGTLADPAVFANMRVELGVVTWPGELDLAPDAMYRAIRNAGEWVPH